MCTKVDKSQKLHNAGVALGIRNTEFHTEAQGHTLREGVDSRAN